MNSNNDWPYGTEDDQLLYKTLKKQGVTIEEIFEEEDILANIRIKSEAFGIL